VRPLEDTPLSARRFWALVAAALFAATLPPYLFGWSLTGPQTMFMGLLYDVPDHTQYWAWVSASARDGLFISNTLTPEPNPPTFMNPMMWLLAQGRRAGLDFPVLFQLWRAVATGAAVVGIVWCTAVLVSDPVVRRTARWVALLGSGLGWTLVTVKVLGGLPDTPYPTDVYTVEPNTFWAILSYPYLALAQGLVAIVLAAAWRAHQQPSARRLSTAALSASVLGATHAYDLLIVYAVLASAVALLTIRCRQVPWRLAGVLGVVGLASAPIALYYRHLTTATPLWRDILAQYANAGVWTPTPPHLVILMGVPLLLAIAGAWLRRRGPEEDQFVIAWAVMGCLLPFLPVVFQIKLLTGWQVPLAILAAHAWHTGWRRYAPAPLARLRAGQVATAALVLLVVPTNLYLYGWRFVELRRQATPYYLSTDEHDALKWLASRWRPQDVVLANEHFGRWVPGYTGMRAALAHWAMTNRYFERRRVVEAFFSEQLQDDERAAVEAALAATYVVWSVPPGALHAPHDPGESDSRALAFERPRARIYVVQSTRP
jgi:hypothetical protein